MDVLITDDSSFMRKVLHNIVKDLEFDEIYEAESGEECIKKFKNKKPVLVLLDIVMGGMSGLETLEKIMEIDENQRVIMISAVGQKKMVEDALNKGAKEFIEKPFDNKDVKETIVNVLSD